MAYKFLKCSPRSQAVLQLIKVQQSLIDKKKSVDPFFEKPFFQKKNFLIPEVQR